MAKLERMYNVPLRKGFRKAPRYRKAKKAMTTLKEFIMQHMKCDAKEVRIGKALNHKIWERGVKNPPHHVKITVVKDDEGMVKAELFGFKYHEEGKEDKKEKKTKKAKKEEKPAEKKEIKKEEVKKEKPKTEKPKPKTAKKAPAKKKPAAKKKTTAKKKKAKTKISEKPVKKAKK